MSERHRHRLRFQIEQSGHLNSKTRSQSLTNDDEMIKVEYVHKRAGDSGARCLLCEHTHKLVGSGKRFGLLLWKRHLKTAIAFNRSACEARSSAVHDSTRHSNSFAQLAESWYTKG